LKPSISPFDNIPAGPPPLRLFVAVLLDKALQEGLTTVLKNLSPLDVPVKWLEPGNLHLTLCFLGDVPPNRVAEAKDKLKKVRQGVKSFEMQVGGLGAFPNLKKPTVLFAPVTLGREPLRALAIAMSKFLLGVGAKQKDREFNAHVTLGRAKGFKGAKTIIPKLEGKVPEVIGKMKVKSFALMQSELKPAGPIYTVLEQFPLAD
jgi:2'-5' RNA ligase